MIVVIEDEVFASEIGLALQSVFWLGYEGRHLIQTDPPYSRSAAEAAVNQWLAGLDKLSQEQAELALEIGLEQAVKADPPEVTIRVAEITNPEWAAVPPRLPIGDALRLLHQPLKLLVEDVHSDGAFLQVIPPSPWREKLRDYLRRGWLLLDHGGGSGMKARLRGLAGGEALRTWTLFDSDALHPGHSSKEADEKRDLCKASKIPYHQLQRREIENYLPPQALQGWAAKSHRNIRSMRRRKAQAFSGLLPDQRYHFNMKDGFAGDRSLPGALPAIFDDCASHRDLQNGFGRDISSLFHETDFPIREEWLIRDGQHPETRAMVQSILRRM